MKGEKSPLRVQSSSFLNFLSSESWTAAGRKDFFDTLKKPPQPELGRLFYDRACKPGSVLTVIYLGVPLPIRSSHLLGDSRASLASSAVLLRIEFTAMDTFTRHRVRSYRTFPPLPEGANRPPAVSLCCTFPQIALGGRYPLSLPCGARTFLMRGLSALRPRLSDPVAHVLYFICRKKSNRLQFLSHADIIQAGIFSERLWI